MNDERIPLKVLGLSYSQTQSGAYALILAQVGGPIRIPVVIGAAEAQSIAMRMEGVNPPRPMTHDLMTNQMHAFGIVLKQVFIYKFEDGIFFSEITLIDADREVTLDARTSDAVALAMRFDAPIFTTRAVMEQTGFVIEEEGSGPADDATDDKPRSNHQPSIENYSIEELEKTLERLIAEEEYEEAARVSEILKRKRENL